jgi:hypothetical protein
LSPSFAARLRRSVPLAACVATGLLLAATSVAQAKARERPYYRHTPAYVCFKSTLSKEGQMVENEMIRGSGSREGDRHARRLVTQAFFTEGTGLQDAARDVHVLVRVYANGKFTLRLFEMDEPLPPICSTPYVDPRDKN